MKVAAILGERQAGLVDAPDPTPKEDWVVVKIHASPMCTEYHALNMEAKPMGWDTKRLVKLWTSHNPEKWR